MSGLASEPALRILEKNKGFVIIFLIIINNSNSNSNNNNNNNNNNNIWSFLSSAKI